MFSSEGTYVKTVWLTDDYNILYSLAPDPQGGALAAVWEAREGNTQALMYQFFDSMGAPRSERFELESIADASLPLLAGVDTLGRGLLLRQAPGESNGWIGQWVDRHDGVLTPPFPVQLPATDALQLAPLAGGGLALRAGGQWSALFPSGQASMQPAPEWLASRPGTDLVLIHGQQAHALVPAPSMIAGSGCQASLLVFTRDGTACGELRFPPVGDTCTHRKLGIGLDGTVVQHLEVVTPKKDCDSDDPEDCDDESLYLDAQCIWRWWPGLLH